MKANNVNRRDAIKTIAGGAAATMLPSTRSRAADSRPNVVFILTDDHRHDAFGFMDKPWLPTPHMDRLAAEGAHFTNSFVTTSLCSPARASFLTGQYASRHGVQNNITQWKDSNVTFMELLKAQGYDVGFIGKWHMPGGKLPDLVGQGKVDRMVSFTHFGGQGTYFDCPLIIDGQKHKQKGYLTDVLTEHAIDFLDQPRQDPFCLYLSHKAVHHDFLPAPRHAGKLDGAPFHQMEENERDYPMGWLHVPQRMNFDKNQQGYYEGLMAVDDSVGAVLGWLDDKGMAENTIVVYAGDNGYYWGEHGLIDKRYAYDEGMKIPHLMRYPRMVSGGTKVEEMVCNIDLAPTLLTGANADPTDDMQGESYLDLAAGKQTKWRDQVYYEYFDDPGFPHPPIRAVRAQDWKLITYPGAKKKFKDELYHLAKDPGERNDLIDDPSAEMKLTELRVDLKRMEAAAK